MNKLKRKTEKKICVSALISV